jgi:hypothetical protein
MHIPEIHLVSPAAQRVVVFVVFTDIVKELESLAPWWLRAFTRKDFRHVFVLLPGRLGTVVVNPLGPGIATAWAAFDPLACAIACRRRGWRVLMFETRHRAAYTHYGWLSCVAVTKALIGIRRWWIVIPRQLYDYLLQHGAVEVNDVGTL